LVARCSVFERQAVKKQRAQVAEFAERQEPIMVAAEGEAGHRRGIVFALWRVASVALHVPGAAMIAFST
jgi:histidinol dehydrogenase